MVPPSQSINAWLETNLFQDFATMPTGEGGDASSKFVRQGTTKDKVSLQSMKVNNDAPRQTDAIDGKPPGDSAPLFLDAENSAPPSVSVDISEIDSSSFDKRIASKMADSEEQGTRNPPDDIEEQTAAAVVLQLLGLGQVLEDVPPESDDGKRQALDVSDKVASSVAVNKDDSLRDSSNLEDSSTVRAYDEESLLKAVMDRVARGDTGRAIASAVDCAVEQCERDRTDIRPSATALHAATGQQNGNTLIIDGSYVVNLGDLAKKLAGAMRVDDQMSDTHSVAWDRLDATWVPSIHTASTNSDSSRVAGVDDAKSSRDKIEGNSSEDVAERSSSSGQRATQETNISAEMLIRAITQNPGLFAQESSSHAQYGVDSSTVNLSLTTLVSQIENSISLTPRRPAKRRKRSSACSIVKIEPDASPGESAPSSEATAKPEAVPGYTCAFPNCGKTFARLYNLKSHQRTHTDERPYKCPACDVAFSRNHDLKRHQKIHENSKPYKCLGCDKLFSRLDALRRHKNNPKSRYACRTTEVATS